VTGHKGRNFLSIYFILQYFGGKKEKKTHHFNLNLDLRIVVVGVMFSLL
jgi:hypothetical protein